jgi:hypothetical protein
LLAEGGLLRTESSEEHSANAETTASRTSKWAQELGRGLDVQEEDSTGAEPVSQDDDLDEYRDHARWQSTTAAEEGSLGEGQSNTRPDLAAKDRGPNSVRVGDIVVVIRMVAQSSLTEEELKLLR